MNYMEDVGCRQSPSPHTVFSTFCWTIPHRSNFMMVNNMPLMMCTLPTRLSIYQSSEYMIQCKVKIKMAISATTHRDMVSW